MMPPGLPEPSLQGAATPSPSRSTVSAGRKVTWLELFFDLIFVAAVAQVAAPLHNDYTLAGVIRFTPLFALIWWAWTGHTVYSTRFSTDDAIQRGLTLVQVFAVAVMAANAKDTLESRNTAGLAAAYAVVRLVLVIQYARARRVGHARELTTRYLTGHGIAALLWLASALVPAPARLWLWAIAFVIDLGTPWMAIAHTVRVPPDPVHLPERFGLFTLILLGEAVVAVMQGMESQEDWTPEAATCAFVGMGLVFLTSGWYFGRAGSERHIRTRRDALRFHLWTYAHFPLYLGVVIAGRGVERVVTMAGRRPLASADVAILTSAAALVVLAMMGISAANGAPLLAPDDLRVRAARVRRVIDVH